MTPETTQAPQQAELQFRGRKYVFAGWTPTVRDEFETYLSDAVFRGAVRRAGQMPPVLADRLLSQTVADGELGAYAYGATRHQEALLIPRNVEYLTFLMLHEIDGSVTLELAKQMFVELGVKPVLDALYLADRIVRS